MRFDLVREPGLAFLITLAAVPMAGCDVADPDPSDDSGDTSEPPEDPTTTSVADTTGDAETTSGGDPTIGGDRQICEAYAAHIVLCYPQQGPNQAMFVEYCASSLDYYGAISPDCLAAAEELFACLVAVDCDAFLDEGNCPTQTAALESCG